MSKANEGAFPAPDYVNIYQSSDSCAMLDSAHNDKANARLIAAAPELLEALKETWRIIDDAGLENLMNGVQLGQVSWRMKAQDARNESLAVIKKAEGI